MSSTLLEVLNQLAEETALARLCTESGDAGDAETIVDPQNLSGIGGVPRLEIGCPVFVTSLETGGTPIGEHSYIDDTPAATSGSHSVLPAFTTLLKDDQTFQVWHKDVGHIDNVVAAINRGLSKWCHRWALIPLTWLADGDMEATGTTSWAADEVFTPTLGKTAATFPFTPSRQVLTVTGALPATTDFAYAYQNIAVTEGEVYNLAVCMATLTAYPRARVYDYTNSAYITLTGDEDEAYGGISYSVKRWTFTIPDDCTRIQVRLGITGVTGVKSGIFSWAALWRQNDRRIVTQARVDSQQKVGRVFELQKGGGEEEEWGESRLVEIPRMVHGPGLGTVPMQIEIPLGGTGPYFYEEWQPYPEFSKTSGKWVMTATTNAPLEWLVAAAGYELYEQLSRTWRQGMVQRMPEPGMPGEKNPWTGAWRAWARRFKPIHQGYLENVKSCRL